MIIMCTINPCYFQCFVHFNLLPDFPFCCTNKVQIINKHLIPIQSILTLFYNNYQIAFYMSPLKPRLQKICWRTNLISNPSCPLPLKPNPFLSRWRFCWLRINPISLHLVAWKRCRNREPVANCMCSCYFAYKSMF